MRLLLSLLSFLLLNERFEMQMEFIINGIKSFKAKWNTFLCKVERKGSLSRESGGKIPVHALHSILSVSFDIPKISFPSKCHLKFNIGIIQFEGHPPMHSNALLYYKKPSRNFRRKFNRKIFYIKNLLTLLYILNSNFPIKYSISNKTQKYILRKFQICIITFFEKEFLMSLEYFIPKNCSLINILKVKKIEKLFSDFVFFYTERFVIIIYVPLSFI